MFFCVIHCEDWREYYRPGGKNTNRRRGEEEDELVGRIVEGRQLPRRPNRRGSRPFAGFRGNAELPSRRHRRPLVSENKRAASGDGGCCSPTGCTQTPPRQPLVRHPSRIFPCTAAPTEPLPSARVILFLPSPLLRAFTLSLFPSLSLTLCPRDPRPTSESPQYRPPVLFSKCRSSRILYSRWNFLFICYFRAKIDRVLVLTRPDTGGRCSEDYFFNIWGVYA